MPEPEITSTSVDYAERRRQRALERSRARRKRIPVAAIFGGVAVVVALCGADVAMSWERVHPGVAVAGVKVGSLRPADAAAALRDALPRRAERPVAMTHGDSSYEITAGDMGLDFDYDAMVSDAMGIGRAGGVLRVIGARAGAWAGAYDLPARPKVDPTRTSTVLDRIAKGTDVPPVDASVRIDGPSLSVEPGKDGRGLDRDRAEALILAAMLSDERTVEAPIVTVPVAISDDEAEAARAVAELMMSGPAIITHKGKSWEFGQDDISKWIAFRRSDEAGSASDDATATSSSQEVTLTAYISQKRAGKTILPKVGAKVGTPAKDARFTTSSGRVTIVPSKSGIGPDMQRLADELTTDLADRTSDRTVELVTTRVEPSLTTERARAMGIKERLSRYTTTYDSGNRPRVNNIHTLGDALDGSLIKPGGTFSFNETVGERTAAKGYQEAGAIVDGKLVQQLGGGICQVGTTIFNTVFESGLPIIERRNHSFYISHYPKGRDATVSWGGPDFKFKNDTEHWVLVSVSYTTSSITISLYGTDPGYDVDASTSGWRNIKPFATEEIKDPDMYVGSKIVEDEGITGRAITVTRTVQKAGEIIRKDSFVSVYRPKIQVVRVGTKVKPRKPKPDSTTPTATP